MAAKKKKKKLRPAKLEASTMPSTVDDYLYSRGIANRPGYRWPSTAILHILGKVGSTPRYEVDPNGMRKVWFYVLVQWHFRKEYERVDRYFVECWRDHAVWAYEHLTRGDIVSVHGRAMSFDEDVYPADKRAKGSGRRKKVKRQYYKLRAYDIQQCYTPNIVGIKKHCLVNVREYAALKAFAASNNYNQRTELKSLEDMVKILEQYDDEKAHFFRNQVEEEKKAAAETEIGESLQEEESK